LQLIHVFLILLSTVARRSAQQIVRGKGAGGHGNPYGNPHLGGKTGYLGNGTPAASAGIVGGIVFGGLFVAYLPFSHQMSKFL